MNVLTKLNISLNKVLQLFCLRKHIYIICKESSFINVMIDAYKQNNKISYYLIQFLF